MSRPPQDQLGQRQLVVELRNAIDAARKVRPKGWSGEDLACMERVEMLVIANPRAVRSTHVKYNLGQERLAWLAALITLRRAE
jgi:hypothetical protein